LGGSELIAQDRGGTISYYLHDGQGSVRTLTNAGGAVTDRYSYRAFGDLRDEQGGTANSYRYTGQQVDVLTGLYSLRERYYNPADGRFLSRDTASPDLTNPLEIDRYLYVADNPINSVDPTGLYFVGDYTANNTTKIEETEEGLQVTGNGVQDVVATETADFNAIEARLIYNDKLFMDIPAAYRQITLVRTQVIIEGEQTEILAVSDFDPALLERGEKAEIAIQTVRQRLDLLARQYNWKLVGGNMGFRHAEDYAIEKALDLGIEEGESLPLGVSNPNGACPVCSRMLPERAVENGIRIATRYLDMDADYIGTFMGGWDTLP
jgi:RHS repeat-associated protein